MCDLSLTAQDDEIKYVIESESETIQSIDNQKQLQGKIDSFLETSCPPLAGGPKSMISRRGKINCHVVENVNLSLNNFVEDIPLTCTPKVRSSSLRTASSPTRGEEFLDANSNNSRKVAFTFAEGATHVAHWKNSSKVAFTLAEVLITLGIIGIVAALTLSSVITNYKEKQTVAQLKKTYSVLAQAFELAKQEYGNVSTWGLGGMYDPQTHITLANNFKRYMKVGTDCVGKSHEYTSKHCVDGSYSDRASYATFYTSDGTLLIFRNWWTSGNANRGTVNIDINGRKGPNTFGKDIFLVFILNDKLLPAGAPEDIYKFEKGCNRLITNPYPGYLKQYGACTAWVLFNENMDYLHCDGLSWTGAKSCKELKQQN